jgi:NADP-dependent 3-hydroxy acid dehydrogenase YdfG
VTRLYSSALSSLGGVDVLIANAGVARKGPIDAVSGDDFKTVMQTNVKGVFLWMRAVLPYMRTAQKGQIIVTSSIMSMRTAPGSALYAASKHAVDGMVGCVRKDLAGSGIKVRHPQRLFLLRLRRP